MAFGEAFESFEGWESESEAAEARAPIRKPSSQPSFRPRPAPAPPSAPQNFVTQLQLEASLARSDGKIKTVADGVSTIQARLAALAAASKKEVDERKKSGDTQGKDLNQKSQMLALLPLLIKAPTIKNPQDSTGQPLQYPGGAPITEISAPDNSTMDALLPLLLVTGMGGTGGLNFGGDASGDGGGMMMLALILAMSNK